MLFFKICISWVFFNLASSSTLMKPPQSALIIGFEKSYEQSLLAYTLSDQSIDSTLIVSASDNDGHLYENLEGIEIIKVNTNVDGSVDKKALVACETLLRDKNILKRAREIQPTFVIFPALRHDACLLPWTKFINSIPVIVTYGPEEDLYAIQRTRLALPIHTSDLWSGFWLNAESRSIVAHADSHYVAPALKLSKQYIPELEINFEELYSKVELVLSSSDSILRSDFAFLNQQPIEIGCHHCRGAHPLPAILQKELVEFRLGTIVATLDESFVSFIEEIARKLPQGRQGQAVAWKIDGVKLAEEKRPENLFIHDDVNRQDLIGYARARVLLSHCGDVELLETAFHGTPVICFPRNYYERKNAQRAINLGLAVSTNDDITIGSIVTAIEHVHKTASYREFARGLSLLIRDRPLPASDRLIYWLGYVARNTERTIKLPVVRAGDVRTFAGDSQLLSGFLVGTIIGVALTLAAVLAWFRTKNSQKQTRKDKKFIR